MSSFGGLILTNRGKNLQSKAQSGVELKYTRIGVGDGYLGTTPILGLNALRNQVKSLNITKLKNLGNGRAVVGAVMSNQDITDGFYFREIGIFAQDPDLGEILYCYGNAGDLAEYISPGGGPDIIEKSIDVQMIVGNAQNVTAVIDESLIYVTTVNEKTGDVVLTAEDIKLSDGSTVEEKMNEVFQSVSDGKSLVAGAITDKGVPTSPTATFQTMADNIEAIETDPSVGTTDATAADILSGKKAVSQGELKTGTMPNRGAVNQNLTAEGQEYTIPQGYHSGLGKIKAAIAGLVASVIKAGAVVGGIAGNFTADATATAAQMLSGAIAYVNGNKITGTIPSKTAQTYTPGTTNQTIAANQFLSGVQTIEGSANCVPGNIKDGVKVFNTVGTLKPEPEYITVRVIVKNENGIGQVHFNYAYWTSANTIIEHKIYRDVVRNQWNPISLYLWGEAYHLQDLATYKINGVAKTIGDALEKYDIKYRTNYSCEIALPKTSLPSGTVIEITITS